MEETVEIIRPKLLLADDSITIRKVVELTFAEEGVDVFAVGDGESAMKKFIEVQPDIVLVDVNMPDPDGYQICEMIKQDESTKNIPVLLLVGSFEPFDTTEAERVGADGFMTKPFQSVRELVGKVTELLGNENGIPPQPVETADIQNLFESSFAETYRASDGGTTDTFLGDAGMDDDLIEASREDGGETEIVKTEEGIAVEDSVQGYDWMAGPTVDVGEPISVNGGFEDEAAPSETAIEEYEPALEAEPEPQYNEPQQEAAEFDAAAPFERVVDDFEDTLEVEEPQAEAAPEPQQVAEPKPEPEPQREPSYSMTNGSTDIDSSPAEDTSSYEPSEEFINIIARRVIEKLSDRAVREIAREAVPRITEKLIREALNQENTKGDT